MLNQEAEKVQNVERGVRISLERSRVGMTIVAFANLGGVKKGSQILYEKGKPPSADYLELLGKGGVDILYVLTGRKDDGMARLIAEADGTAVLRREAAKYQASLYATDHDDAPPDEPLIHRDLHNPTWITSEYVPIPLHDVALSAGPGAENSSAVLVDRLAFRRDFLRRLSVQPGQACLARIERDSMVPTLFPGDMVLIDTARIDLPLRKTSDRDKRRAPVYAFVEDGQARVKRIERPEPNILILISDNPDYSPQVRTGAQIEQLQIAIIGKVVWSGHVHSDR